MNYKAHRDEFIRLTALAGLGVNESLFSYCVDLSATEFRWFKTNIKDKEVFFEIQDGGTHWKLIQFDHADQFTLSIGGLSQYVVFYANPITQEEFTRILKQAMWRLLRTSK